MTGKRLHAERWGYMACTSCLFCSDTHTLSRGLLPLPLQELSIKCICFGMDSPEPCFDTAPLAQLPHLSRLELVRFESFDLRSLLPSLRSLRAVGCARLNYGPWPAAETWGIPEACRWAGVVATF